MTILKFLRRLTQDKTTADHELPVRQPKSTPYLSTSTSAHSLPLQQTPPTPRHEHKMQTPEGVGTRDAWLQVLITHLIIMNSFGLIQSFGIFQLPYSTLLHKSPSTIAWIGGVHIFFVYFLGIFSGWALDRGYYKRLLFLGSILQIIGLLGAGFSKTYWITLISHGVVQGIGNGLMFCPAVTTTAVYFKDSKVKTLALAIAGCGASTGGILFSLIAKYLVDEMGIGYTLWILCGVVALFSGLIQLLAHMSPEHTHNYSLARTASPSHIIEWHTFTSAPYALYVLAMFFVFTGLWIPFCTSLALSSPLSSPFNHQLISNTVYIRPLTSSYPTLSSAPSLPSTSVPILIALNAAGIPGRILPALVADRLIGTLNTCILVLLLTSTTLLCWPFVTSASAMLSWAMAYGFGAGGVGSLFQAGVIALTDEKEKEKIGGRIGMVCGVVGVASLLGGPVGGELARIGGSEGRDGFVWMMVFTGGIMVVGCAVLAVARGVKTGDRWRIRI